MSISAVLLVLIIASYLNPGVRDRLLGVAGDCMGVLRDFRDFVLRLFRQT
jgi:hypothetical protein